MRPLIVCSIPESPFIRELATHPVDVVSIHDPTRPARVVYMRTGYEIELNSPNLSIAVGVEHAYGGAIVVNPVTQVMAAQRKDLVYARLGEVGIPVPHFLPQPTYQEMLARLESGEWRLPFILRTVDGAGCKGMYLISNLSELEPAFMHLHGQRIMAVEYINTWRYGSYHVYRLYVIGDELDMYSIGDDKQPFIKWENGTQAYDLPDDWIHHAIDVGRVLGIHVYRVDMVEAKDGQHFITDINPTYFITKDAISAPEPILERRRGHFDRLVQYLYGLMS